MKEVLIATYESILARSFSHIGVLEGSVQIYNEMLIKC